LAAKGEERTEPTTPLLKALPTKTHMSLVSMLENNLCQYIISQNIDGLHRKSGVHPDKVC
jgi:NAD-dependent SIR2 family protein deacetylase